ncbi:MAG: TonB-dependent receptor [Opitutaceae bacterium]
MHPNTTPSFRPGFRRPTAGSILLAASLFAAIAPVVHLHAQTRPAVDATALRHGSLTGTLAAAPGKPLTEVVVSVRETGAMSTVDRHGRYEFTGLPAGTYTLVASGPGFSRLRITDIVIRPGTETLLGMQEMPAVVKDGEVQQLQEVVVSAKKEQDIQRLDRFLVEESKAKPFSDSNVDIPRTMSDPQAYYIFDSKAIDQSGALNVEDFLKQRLTMGSTNVSNDQKSSYYANFTQRSNSNIALRGLASSQTLILVNGRRQANVQQGGTYYQPDLNGIALGSIDRIEILPSSASGIYGGGAVGGVINIITKRGFNGGELRVSYGSTFDTHSPATTAALSYGFSLEGGRTQVSLSAQHAEESPLQVRDRGYLLDNFRRYVSNNPAAVLSSSGLASFAPPSGIIVAQSGNLAGTNSSFIVIPDGYPGVAIAGLTPLLAGAGQYGRLTESFPDSSQPNMGLRQELGSLNRRKSFRAEVRRQMTSNLEVFVEGTYSSNFGDGSTSPLATVVAFPMPANAPSNPFKQPVFVSWEQKQALYQRSNNYSRGAAAGFKLKLPKEWLAEGDYSWSRSFSRGEWQDGYPIPLSESLSSGAFNPLRDMRLNPLDITPYILTTTQTYPSTSNVTALRWWGPVWTLPAGPITLNGNSSYRKEGLPWGRSYAESQVVSAQTESYTAGQVQNITSTNAELTFPIFSRKNARPGLAQLDLQVAASREWYGVKTTRSTSSTSTNYTIVSGGVRNTAPFLTTHTLAKYDSANPTFAIGYSPIKDVMIRASTATAFLPPGYSQLTAGVLGTRASNVVDPRRGNASTSVFTITGGNPNLTPEESRSTSGGVIITPRFIPNLRLSFDYTEITKNNNIGNIGAQLIVNNEAAFPDRVTRNPLLPGDTQTVGVITRVDATLLNLYQTEIETFDARADYRWETAERGTFSIGTLASWQPHFKQQLSLTAPMLEYAGYSSANYPLRFRAHGTLTWEVRRWVMGWTTTYFDEYKIFAAPLTTATANLISQGAPTVGSQTVHDVFVSYRVPRAEQAARWRDRWLAGTDIQLNIRNVFNTAPEFDATAASTQYGSPWIDARMMEFSVSVKRVF